ncbi:MAG: HD domain-containing protein [Candidatus Omnitrophica bacterium]|nr:HD domain-containing protein [Candidatus Omnitrophota bacterium]
MSDKNVLNFFAEAGMLKRIKRSGWWVVGIPHDESVAEHSFRCAVIGYVLAKMEGANVEQVLKMTLFNDLHEARITDMHKMAHKYVDVRDAEKKAFSDQIEKLEEGIKKDLESMRQEHDGQKTIESLVARDADILECLVQAKEYVDLGFKTAEKFFKKAPDCLKTESAKKLWAGAGDWDSGTWWEELGKFER